MPFDKGQRKVNETTHFKPSYEPVVPSVPILKDSLYTVLTQLSHRVILHISYLNIWKVGIKMASCTHTRT